MRKYRAVLFDFEGTLVDFQWKIDQAVAEVVDAIIGSGLLDVRLLTHNYADLFNSVARSAKDQPRAHSALKKRVEDIYDSFDLDALSRWAPRADTVHVLEELNSRAVSTGLVTNIGRKAIDAGLERFRLERFLPVVVTRNDMTTLKPDRNGIDKAVDHLGAFKHECLFVGDSVTDVLAAKNAKIDVAIVLGGESKEETIIQHEPNFIVEDLSKILALI